MCKLVRFTHTKSQHKSNRKHSDEKLISPLDKNMQVSRGMKVVVLFLSVLLYIVCKKLTLVSRTCRGTIAQFYLSVYLRSNKMLKQL